jgi:propanol-preferring alcohol dehydrogenase
VPDPDSAPGEVVVRVAAAGACHSDLHLMHDFDPGLLPYTLPFTLGHENTGIVESAGAGVQHLAPGEPVAVYGLGVRALLALSPAKRLRSVAEDDPC